ncbi:Probable RNA-directed DNA polymerase from transposon X-element [Eumeta japonica]|uniref:Probable RNA-directed DNA polymerase from transposon X-element n=1 Tax=Eumeta variegata TaxID=151549 RepID=A0A4C1WNJ7_EUMVA|nr:Probable RNA-directed DNA polymerase from transposon X-element [Eumeta japonica]
MRSSDQILYRMFRPTPCFVADVLDVVICHQLPYRIHVEDVELAAQHFTDKVRTAYSAAITRLPAPKGRRWDLPPRLQFALQEKRNLQKLWARTRYPRINRDLYRIAQELRQAVCTFRGVAWKETIEQAGDDWKSLHLLCRHLTRAPAPVCPLFNRTGMRRYAAKDRAEILAEHLEEQFIPHLSLDSLEATSHHARVERCVQKFLEAPVPQLPRDYFVFPAKTVKSIVQLPKQKSSGTRRDLNRSHKTAA